MADDVRVSYEIVGLKELMKALEDLGSEVAGKHVAPALRMGTKPVLQTAQNDAPVSDHEDTPEFPPGRLRRALRIKKMTRPTKSSETYFVEIKPGKTRDDPDGAWYGHFVELGTVKMAARPFLRNALEKNRRHSIEVFKREIAKRIEKEAKRIGNENAAKVGAKFK